MKFLFILFAFAFTQGSSAAEPPLHEVRLLYQQAENKKDACKKLISILKPYQPENNPVLAAYRACATMMMAKYVFNPFSKISNFNEGKSLLEKSIKADKNNIELRFLRFAVQTNAPSFLGYTSSINNDKTLLMSHYGSINDQQLKKIIGDFLRNSDHLNNHEKQRIR